MLTTMTEAAELLGIPKQRLYQKIKEGKVTGRKVGERVVLVDTEKARRELERSGYFRRSEMYRRKKAARQDNDRASDR